MRLHLISAIAAIAAPFLTWGWLLRVTGIQSQHNKLWCPIGTSPQNRISKFAYPSQLATVQVISHMLLTLSCVYYLIVSATVETYLH